MSFSQAAWSSARSSSCSLMEPSFIREAACDAHGERRPAPAGGGASFGQVLVRSTIGRFTAVAARWRGR